MAIERNDLNLLEFLDKHPPKFLTENPKDLMFEEIKWNHEVLNALLEKRSELVKYIIENKKIDISDLNVALAFSIEHNRDLVELLIQKGANDWTLAVESAGKIGDISLMEYFASKGPVNWENVQRRIRRAMYMDGKLTPEQKEAVNQFIKMQLN